MRHCMPNSPRAIPRLLHCFGRAIRNACCAPTRSSKRPARRWHNGKRKSASPCSTDCGLGNSYWTSRGPNCARGSRRGSGPCWPKVRVERSRCARKGSIRPCRQRRFWDCANFGRWRTAKSPEAQAIETGCHTATRQFAKRQTTWFRHRMADWHRLDATETAGIVAQIAA